MSAPITQRVHNGRGLTTWEDPETKELEAGWPEMAYESVRAINHLTFGGTVPAPVLYDVLGNLKGIGHLLPQALEQLSAGLEKSLVELDVYDRAGDAAGNVALATAHMARAAECARELGEALERAQSAIGDQGLQHPTG